MGEKPKICVLFCGGTIVMSTNAKTGAHDVAGSVEDILNIEPRLKDSFDLSIIFVDNLDSTDMTPLHWSKLVAEISKNYDLYDGFVITHGTNTLGYTSSALSFALQGIGKPVVLTGAQIPANQLESDARQNFVNSVKVAGMDLAGVFVVFGSKIINGARAKKDNEYDLNAFKTYNGSDLGEIGIRIDITGRHNKRHSKPFAPKAGFEPAIAVLTLEPGIQPKQVDALFESGIRGLVIRAYGAGDVPSSLYPCLQKAKDKKIPVVITTQCPNGVSSMDLNKVGYDAHKLGVIRAFDMSMESMTTKLHWLLSQNTPYEKIKKIMETDLCGEIAPPAQTEADEN